MFQLQIELSLLFVPLMDEVGPGITLLQTFDLPFAPFEGLEMTGVAFNPHASSIEGFPLRGLTWDVDRKLFLAKISLVTFDHPIALIPDELQAWTRHGWTMGSADTHYRCDDEGEGGEASTQTEERSDDSEEQMELLPTMPHRSRPAEFNRLLRSVVRELALIFNNSRTAYAVCETQAFFTEQQLEESPSRLKERFKAALDAFDQMSFHDRDAWREKVLRRFPKLESVVTERS